MGSSANHVGPIPEIQPPPGALFGSVAPRRRRGRPDAGQQGTNQWQDIRKVSLGHVPSKKFCDIVGSLPLELVLQIVEYLDPADIVRSQRVSKQWRSIFSSDPISRLVIRQTLAFLNIEGKSDVAVANETAYFQWRHSLQCGWPIRKVFIPWPEPKTCPKTIMYRSRRLVYYTELGNVRGRVEMLNLEAGERTKWIEQEEGRLSSVELLMSDRYVVKMAQNRRLSSFLTAWDMHTSLPCASTGIPDPDPTPHKGSISKDKVAIVRCDVKKSADRVYIWDLSSNHVRYIASLSNLWLWHLNAEGNNLVTFEINWDAQGGEVQQTKWALTTGQLLERKRRRLPVPLRANRLYLRQLYFSRWQYYRIHTLANNTTINRLPYGHENGTIDLMYDQTIDKLSIRFNDCIQPRFQGLHQYSTLLTPRIIYEWNSNLRRIEIFDALNQSVITTPQYRLNPLEAAALAAQYQSRDRRANREKHFFLPFGDPEVFGLASNYAGIQLWIFNPDFTPVFPVWTLQ